MESSILNPVADYRNAFAGHFTVASDQVYRCSPTAVDPIAANRGFLSVVAIESSFSLSIVDSCVSHFGTSEFAPGSGDCHHSGSALAVLANAARIAGNAAILGRSDVFVVSFSRRSCCGFGHVARAQFFVYFIHQVFLQLMRTATFTHFRISSADKWLTSGFWLAATAIYCLILGCPNCILTSLLRNESELQPNRGLCIFQN